MSSVISSFVPDVDGLICAFELCPLMRRGRDVLVGDALPQPLWLHFNLSNARTRHWLEVSRRIPRAAREFLLEPDTRSRIEPCDEGFGVVVSDVYHDFDADPEGFGALRIFVDARFIISARNHPLRTADTVRRDLLHGFDSGSTLSLFEHFVGRLAETFESVIEKLGEQVDDAEDKVLAGELDAERARLVGIRRLLARLRRHINGDRVALGRLPALLPSWCDVEQRRSLREVVERLSAAAQDLELVQERARLLQEEIAGRVGEATNRNLFVLSTVTTVLLPVTLITGIFGMNVTGLPFSSHPGGFWWVLSAIVIAIAIALSFLHKQRVL